MFKPDSVKLVQVVEVKENVSLDNITFYPLNILKEQVFEILGKKKLIAERLISANLSKIKDKNLQEIILNDLDDRYRIQKKMYAVFQ